MEAVETNTNNKRGTKNPQDNGSTQQARKPRRLRKPPMVFKSDELKEPVMRLPKVSQRGVSIETLETRKHTFALTPDGESLNIKLSKSQSFCIDQSRLYDHEGLTVYPYSWT
jgi:hypothetical protein